VINFINRPNMEL